LAPGLVIAAVPAREDARDLLITRAAGDVASLPAGGRVGTGSLRRTALLRRQRADLEIVELRGNVDTRLRKLEAGDFDAVVLAAAGLKRLGIEPQHASPFDPREFVPAIGQGALAIECRAGELASVLAALDDESTRVATTAERAFLARIGGSCHTPLGAHAIAEGQIDLNAVVASPDGSRAVRGSCVGTYAEAQILGHKLAEDLLNAGAAEILASLEAPCPAPPLDHP
jgi:hydroxymethylbilane synthase